MELKELIQAALKKAGLPEDLWEKIQVEKDDEIEAAVEAFKKTYNPPSKTFAQFITEHGYEDDLKALVTSEADRRVNQAIETFSKKLNLPKKDDKQDGDTGIAAALEPVLNKINELSLAIQGQEEAQKKTRLSGLIASKVKEVGLPESWVSRVQVKEESEIETAVKELETEFTKIKQEAVDKALEDTGYPGFSKKDGSAPKSGIDAFAKTLDAESSDKIPVEKLD